MTNGTFGMYRGEQITSEKTKVGFFKNGVAFNYTQFTLLEADYYIQVVRTPVNKILGIWLATDTAKTGTNYITFDSGKIFKMITRDVDGAARNGKAKKQGFIKLDTTLSDGTEVIVDYETEQILKPIAATFGRRLKVSDGSWEETASISKGNEAPNIIHWNKFGSNPVVSTSVVDIWEYGGTQTLMAAAAGLKISSSSVSDTDVDITIELIDDEWNLVILIINTDGQTEKDIHATDTYLRVNRAYISGSTAAVGTIYIYEDDTVVAGVPQTAAKVHASILPAEQQTKLSFFSVPMGYSGFIYAFEGSTAAVTGILTLTLQIREFGGVFRTKYVVNVSGSTSIKDFRFPLFAPEKSDIKVTGITTVGSHDAEIDYTLLIIKNTYA